MSKALSEYFGSVTSFDIADYGFGTQNNFLDFIPHSTWDWVVTNPPFRLAEQFIERSLALSRVGCAFLVRTTFVESIGRYNRLFSQRPPAKVAQFVERVPMVKGRLDPKASTATGYCWLVWQKDRASTTELVWIPPCRKSLEYKDDYPTSQLSLV